ncbi:DUF551 domain-containing protein [Enterobacter cloacae subsp. cloacae]|nr:DUF551 domain-containing protein [Enterobacter cloacae]MDR9913262.1 DUF551 domain-containing protein [Enterobacter cloacae subsp. cloacae]
MAGGRGRIVYTAPPAPVVPAELHSDTQKLVTDFCTALAEKLYKAQLKYGYDADWKHDGWPTQCQAHFHQHIAKGDPRDVAAYCAFMWYHGWKTEPAPVSVPAAMEMDDDFDSAFEHGKAVGWNACRAAILQSFGNSEQLNSPVIQDGWVACVERMPSAGEQVLAYRPDAPESNDPLIKMATYVGGSAHGHGFDCYCKPTHWMPLPAAPQQEVK